MPNSIGSVKGTDDAAAVLLRSHAGTADAERPCLDLPAMPRPRGALPELVHPLHADDCNATLLTPRQAALPLPAGVSVAAG